VLLLAARGAWAGLVEGGDAAGRRALHATGRQVLDFSGVEVVAALMEAGLRCGGGEAWGTPLAVAAARVLLLLAGPGAPAAFAVGGQVGAAGAGAAVARVLEDAAAAATHPFTAAFMGRVGWALLRALGSGEGAAALAAAPGGAAQGSLLVAWALGELRRAGTAPNQEDLAGAMGAVEAALATFGAEEWAGFVGRLQKGGAEAAKAQLALALAAARAPSKSSE
jgi:hypothetical protein